MNQGSPSEAGPAIHFGRPTAPDALAWVDARVGSPATCCWPPWLMPVRTPKPLPRQSPRRPAAELGGLRAGAPSRVGGAVGSAFGDHRSASSTPARLLDLVDRAGLDPAVAKAAVEVFTAIGEVEAAVHGVPLEQVHFHEVGALDTVADVVGTLAAWHSLECPQVVSSVVGVGSGWWLEATGN